MTALKLDASGDLAIENGSLVVLDDLTAETAQRLQTKFRFFLGEWHLDTRMGFPLYEKVFIKSPKLSELRVLYRELISTDEGVETLDELELDFDSSARELSLSFAATLIDGSVLEVSNFILQENL
jgi:hypothetical protein